SALLRGSTHLVRPVTALFLSIIHSIQSIWKFHLLLPHLIFNPSSDSCRHRSSGDPSWIPKLRVLVCSCSALPPVRWFPCKWST
ncbi:hypothetical protein SDJN02_20074, partial [Cucurbita argyrosperma subsp. argyrosperma]